MRSIGAQPARAETARCLRWLTVQSNEPQAVTMPSMALFLFATCSSLVTVSCMALGRSQLARGKVVACGQVG